LKSIFTTEPQRKLRCFAVLSSSAAGSLLQSDF
jgi:hypothetical protein